MAIKIEVHKKEFESVCGVVRLDPKAERVLKELCNATGLSAKYLASQIIVQGADDIEIVEK